MMSLLIGLVLVCGEAFAFSPLQDQDALNARRYYRWVDGLEHREPVGGYRTVDGFHREIKALVVGRPGVLRPFVLGHSVQRRPIWGFRISAPGTEIHTKVLVFAGIHALEWISTEAATALLMDIATLTPRGVEVTVVPLLNPDGREKVEQDQMAGRRRYRRGNARNVDLNRDFAVNRKAKAIWRFLLPAYYRSTKAALSQPESQALDRLAAKERFDVAVSLHAFGGFVYTPWAGIWSRPDDWKTFHALGTTMSQAQGAHAYKVRQLSRWGFFFRAHGAEIDHLYGEYGTLSFLIELSRSGLSPWRPSTFKNPFDWYNPVRPARHIDKGVSAVRGLVHTLAAQEGVSGSD
jgi:hypothetical protein